MFPTLLLLIPCSGIYLVHSQKPCSLLKAHLGQFSTLPPNQTHTHTHSQRHTPLCFSTPYFSTFFFFLSRLLFLPNGKLAHNMFPLCILSTTSVTKIITIKPYD